MTLLVLTMDVVEKTKPRVEMAMVIIHGDEVELLVPRSESQGQQNGAQMLVDEVGPPVFQKEIKSSLCTPQNGEVTHVVESAPIEASPQALLKPGAPVTEEKALPLRDPQEKETPACNMRSESGVYATEGGESSTVQTESEETKFTGCFRIERKFSCSEEASVDVHSDDSEERDIMVSVVDHPLLQKNCEEFAGVAQGETEPSLAAKWTHEVSIDVFIPDGWVETEMLSHAEPETSGADIATDFAEPVNRNLTTEHEAPAATGAVEFEKQEVPQVCENRMETTELENQGTELISQSLGIQESVTRMETEVASPNSSSTPSVNHPEQPLPGSVERESNHSNECETLSQVLQDLPVQVGEAPKNDMPTSTQDEDRDLRASLLPTSREASESMAWEFTSTQVERVNMADVERIIDVDSHQGEGHVKNTGRVPSFVDWERVIEVDARATDVTMVEVLETSSAPPKQSKGTAEIREQDQQIWSLKNLKKRPLLLDARTVTEQSIRLVKPKAPKVVGLSWPPMPLTDALGKHYVDMEDAVTSPRHRTPESVGVTDTIIAEVNEAVLESESSPFEQPEGVDGAEANIKEKNLQRIWSLEYLKKRPLMVETRAVTEQSIRVVKPKAPKVVGLSWPPMPLTDAQDKHCVNMEDAFTSPRQESVGATESTVVAEANHEVVLESRSSSLMQPDGVHEVEVNIKEKNLQGIWSLEILKERPLMVETRTATEQSIRLVKPKAPKFVGLSWPPTPLTMAPGINGVFT